MGNRPCAAGSVAIVGGLAGVIVLAVGGCGPQQTPQPPTPGKPETPPVAAEAADVPATQVDGDGPPKLPFVDVTAARGVTTVHVNGATGGKYLPETGGAGCALWDFDGDGDLDLVLAQGLPWPNDAADAAEPPTLALYRNDGGQFADVTRAMGLDVPFYGQGLAVGDYDGDGDDDLFCTAVGRNRLFRNDGERFTEVAAEVGVAGSEDDWTTSCGFFDYDRDGDLDLFVCNYVRWSPELDDRAERRLTGTGRSYAHPANFSGTHNYLYRNDDGRFRDVSAEAGMQVFASDGRAPLGKALAATFVDFDRDGWLDIAVANDTVRHFLYRNLQNGAFVEEGELRGFAYNAQGDATSGMGVDATWVGRSPLLALAIGNFHDEMSEIYVKSADAEGFEDQALGSGVGSATRSRLTFGVAFADFDLDGRDDLIHANGHLEETIAEVDSAQSYAQPTQLFWNASSDDQVRFVEVPPQQLGALPAPIVGRGAAVGDLDGDGDPDLALTQVAGPPRILLNEQTAQRHWLRLKLTGAAGNPHAIGTKVTLHLDDRSIERAVMPTRGYLSQSEPVVTVGLGDAERVERVEITWPDGTLQELSDVPADQTLEVRQSAESVATLANRAAAQFENGAYDAAIALWRTALEKQPDSAALRRNLVRGLILGGRPDEASAALEPLSAAESPASASTAYLRGLTAVRRGDLTAAGDYFAEAVRLDPQDATLQFQLGQALLANSRPDDALPHLQQAVQLDPLHGAAYYQLATLARKRGDNEAFREAMRNYQRIRDVRGAKSPAALEQCRYTDPEPPEATAAPPEPVTPPAFTSAAVSVTQADGSPYGGSAAAVAVWGMLENQRYRLAVASRDGELLLVDAVAEDRLQVVERMAAPTDLAAAQWTLAIANAIVDPIVEETASDDESALGDQPEIALVSPAGTRLVRYAPGRGCEDLTSASGLGSAAGHAARWIDLDHDGDVDLVVASDVGLRLWRNNGDGSFVDATTEFAAPDAPTTDLASADFDGANLGVDLVVVGADGVQLVRNQLSGQFALEPNVAGNLPQADRVVVDDFNNDGLPEIALARAGSFAVGRPGAQFAGAELPLEIVSALATLDYDNDGWLDAVAAGTRDGRPAAWLAMNQGGRLDQLAPLPTDVDVAWQAAPQQLLDLDFDGDGDTDLLAIPADGGPLALLRNDTPTENRQVKLSMHSFAGHPSSIGTRVQVRRENLSATRWTQREAPIEIGIGPQPRVDAIQTLWPNGVLRNEIDVDCSDGAVEIVVIEFIRTDSCPFLYAHRDGRWEFVTDLLGIAPLNVAVARGVGMPPDPSELFVLGSAADWLDAEGRLDLRLTSELREVIYVDQFQLMAVEHPADVRLFARDRVERTPIEGPAFLAGRRARSPWSARGSDGVDRTAALQAIDDDFAAPGPAVHPPAVGFTQPWTLTLDFGPLAADEQYLLALSGWFRFGNASTNIAASQRSDVQGIWPRLEAIDAAGRRTLIDDACGFPAGNLKTIVCDLRGKLPPGTRQLLLTTSFEVRWDSIELYEAVDEQTCQVAFHRPIAAELGWHGFHHLRSPSPDHAHVPLPGTLTDQPPWLTAVAGWCTRYGDVAPLVDEVDGKLAILNSGDAATFRFQLPSPPAPAAPLQRTLLAWTHGWIKAGDPNCLPDQRVEPLPGTRSADAAIDGEDWELEYNTRWVPRERFRP